MKGQLFPLEKYPSQPSSYYCLLSQRPSQKRGRGLGEVTETKITVIKEDSSTPWSQKDKAIQRAVLCHWEGTIWKLLPLYSCAILYWANVCGLRKKMDAGSVAADETDHRKMRVIFNCFLKVTKKKKEKKRSTFPTFSSVLQTSNVLYIRAHCKYYWKAESNS